MNAKEIIKTAAPSITKKVASKTIEPIWEALYRRGKYGLGNALSFPTYNLHRIEKKMTKAITGPSSKKMGYRAKDLLYYLQKGGVNLK